MVFGSPADCRAGACAPSVSVPTIIIASNAMLRVIEESSCLQATDAITDQNTATD
jgi:hypothetical protein